MRATSPGDADIVYGGGIYDGRYAIDPGFLMEYIDAIWLPLFKEPEDVLEIGFVVVHGPQH